MSSSTVTPSASRNFYHHAAAIIPASDINLSTEFYAQLGFYVVSDHGDYRLLTDGKGWHLHLNLINDWAGGEKLNQSGIYLYCENVDELAAKVESQILEAEKKPTNKPWGMYEFALSDPCGTLVRIGWPSAEK